MWKNYNYTIIYPIISMEEILVKITTFLLLLVNTSAETYYVKPSTNTPCPEEDVPCFTLSQYANKSLTSSYFASNTTLIILPGNHSLDLELSICNNTFLSVVLNTVSLSDQGTSITCHQTARFTIENVDVVEIKGLVLLGCVNNKVTLVEHFILEDCYLEGQGRNGTGLELNEVSSADIIGSVFSSNTGRDFLDEVGSRIGGAIIIMGIKLGVTISDSIFKSNTANYLGGAVFADSCNITFNSCLFTNNKLTRGVVGGGGGGAIYARLGSITLINSTFDNNTVAGDDETLYSGFGLVVTNNSTLNSSHAVSTFVRGGGALYAKSSTVIIYNSVFSCNSVSGIRCAVRGGAVYASKSFVIVINSEFKYNMVTGDDGGGGALFVKSSPITLIDNSTFHNNRLTFTSLTTNPTCGGGAVCTLYSPISINNSMLISNSVTGYLASGGAMYSIASDYFIISSSEFSNNTVFGDNGSGGAVYSSKSPIIVDNSTFKCNFVTGGYTTGGAVYADRNVFFVTNSKLNNNSVIGIHGNGGAVFILGSTNIIIENSTLSSNSVVGNYGRSGAVHAIECLFTIHNSTFDYNTVTGIGGRGGAIYHYGDINRNFPTLKARTYTNILIINISMFNNNTVTGFDGSGGAVFSDTSRIIIENSFFTANAVTDKGSALYLLSGTLNSFGTLDVQNNSANTAVIYAVESTLNFSGSTAISNNCGSIFVYSCNMTFLGETNILNNIHSSNTSQEGGAVTGFQSDIVFTSTSKLMYNSAVWGGGISVTQSKLYVFGNVTVSQNSASVSGGGIYAYTSELNFRKSIEISSNSAKNRGGGIYAVSTTTSLTDSSSTFIVGNHAKRGGGICLESSAKIYLLKLEPVCHSFLNVYFCELNGSHIMLHLHRNTADYGGAVYIADDTNSATCFATPFSDETTISSECFIQQLSLYKLNPIYTNLPSINFEIYRSNFTGNSAMVAGDVIYGGLLDRCGASPFSEIFEEN